MKCPKCSYLGFETGDRCRNCGYDFSLFVDLGPASNEPEWPLHELGARPYAKTSADVVGPVDEAPFRQPDEPLAEIQLADLGSSSPALPDTLVDWAETVNGEPEASGPAMVLAASPPPGAGASPRRASVTPPVERAPLELRFDAPRHGDAAAPLATAGPSAIAAAPSRAPRAAAPPPSVTPSPAELLSAEPSRKEFLHAESLRAESLHAEPRRRETPRTDPVRTGPPRTAARVMTPPPEPRAAAPKPVLPLFSRDDADAPLVSVPAVLRPPLAVRRTPVPPARPRITPSPVASAAPPPPSPQNPVLEFGLEAAAADGRVHTVPAAHSAPAAELRARATETSAPDARLAGGVGPRAVAGLIDHGILVAVDVVVLYFTLRMTGLTASEWSVLPLAPLLAFLAFVKIAYFGTFTVVGGQTIGKMATRLQVVSDDFSAVSVSRSLWRSAASLASVVSFGAGLLPILLGRDRRAFHDRVAGTRVVSMPSA